MSTFDNQPAYRSAERPRPIALPPDALRAYQARSERESFNEDLHHLLVPNPTGALAVSGKGRRRDWPAHGEDDADGHFSSRTKAHHGSTCWHAAGLPNLLREPHDPADSYCSLMFVHRLAGGAGRQWVHILRLLGLT